MLQLATKRKCGSTKKKRNSLARSVQILKRTSVQPMQVCLPSAPFRRAIAQTERRLQLRLDSRSTAVRLRYDHCTTVKCPYAAIDKHVKHPSAARDGVNVTNEWRDRNSVLTLIIIRLLLLLFFI